jgi:hypothetical protein
MLRKIVVRNKSSSELGIMLEPWTNREDVEPGSTIEVVGDFVDEEVIIDVGNENFISIWSPPRSIIRKVG